ncbi:MAG: hypothetical protein RBQ97_06250 [Acholeplasma sp.]|nr:hypothetical protein [Acholeplasma sp.]
MGDQVSKSNMKAISNISRIQVRNETLMLLLDLYESKGKTFYYDDLFKKDIDAFLKKSLEEDIYEIAKYLNLDLTDARINLCAKRDFVPKNKDEQLLFNIKKVLYRIQNNSERFELIANEIHELGKTLGSNHTSVNWQKTKSEFEDGLFDNSNFKNTREALEKLISLYKSLIKAKEYELVNVNTNFYVDFVNMQIFDNLNDLIALFVLYSLIFQTFPIFKYVSFFKHFRSLMKPWEYAINQANYNWASKFPQTDNLTELVYRMLIESYKEVDDFAYSYEFERDLNKSDSLENTILKFKKLFTKEDLREVHPTISDSTINRTLQRLKDERKIIVIGAGRSSKWQVIDVRDTKFSRIELFKDKED